MNLSVLCFTSYECKCFSDEGERERERQDAVKKCCQRCAYISVFFSRGDRLFLSFRYCHVRYDSSSECVACKEFIVFRVRALCLST